MKTNNPNEVYHKCPHCLSDYSFDMRGLSVKGWEFMHKEIEEWKSYHGNKECLWSPVS